MKTEPPGFLRTEIDGQAATVGFLDQDGRLVAPADAVTARARLADGRTLSLRRKGATGPMRRGLRLNPDSTQLHPAKAPR